MGTLRLVVAAVACATACKQGSNGNKDVPPATGAASAAGSLAGAVESPASPPPAASRPDIAAPVAAAGSAPEIVLDDLYRAPGGGALFRAPDLAVLKQSWSRTFRRDGAVAAIQYTYVDGPRRAQIELRFPPHQPTAMAARALAEASAASVAKQMPDVKTLGGRELPLPGGSAWGVGLETTLAGAKVVIGVVAITDGGDAVLVTTVAHAELYEAPAVKPVLDGLFAGIQVGRKVTSAPSLAPATTLSGVFIRIGPDLGEVHVVQFDPRGWALLDRDVGRVDLDAAHAARGGALSRYQVAGDEIRVTDPRGRVAAFRLNGGDLEHDGRTYCRSASTDGWTLRGTYESPTFVNTTGLTGETFTANASSRYVFAADGTFRDSSTVSATLSQPTTPGGPATPSVTSGSSGGASGTYRIRGDRLELTRGGQTTSLPFYARACAGKPSNSMVVIGGDLYLLDDD